MRGTSGSTIEMFLGWLEKEGKSGKTILTYQQELKKFDQWLGERGLVLMEISHDDVQEYMIHLEEQGKSPITTDKVLGVIRTLTRFLKRPDVGLDIRIKHAPKKDEIDVLTKEECEGLLAEVRESRNARNEAIVLTLLHTGIRVSELCGLDLTDLDLERGVVKVSDTHGDERVIPLTDALKSSLMAYLDEVQPVGPLFVSRSRERLTERSVQYMLKKFHVNAQKLRHTFCQQLVDRGVSLEVVSRLAGHRDINVTRRYVKTAVEGSELERAIRETFSHEG
ncbi:tyrosine-type recombinase/integrase [Rossellomorea marisflavi]|uniref:tyrosine-type recombinase/integrase n=2 Tax=Rossellomorea marisflavi TaxID=189381 RepID=UPI00285303E8|nr:tyrosine-type recombinase/integrase [Rossellomorea marisflavi]MDR4938943.1 tyrosine-type recombinase/integrase [Rossellomorea marisflavi]